MNQIELRSEIRPSADGAPPALHVSIVIDGQPVGDRFVLDWKELYLTIKHPGEFFFWTSRNGEPLEENIQDPTFVERTEECVTWRWLSPVSLDDLGEDDDRDDAVAQFECAAYEKALRQGWRRALALLRANPAAQVYPRGFGEAGLQGLEDWANSDDAKPFQPLYA